MEIISEIFKSYSNRRADRYSYRRPAWI